MMRNSILAVLCALAVAAPSLAQVTIWHSAASTPGLPGFQTWTAMATSVHPIIGIDFAGSGDNDPFTGFGYFGPMNQVMVAGQPTPYQDHNSMMAEPLQDSQFLVRTTDVTVQPGVTEESTSLLQGAWTWGTPQGTNVSFAQVVVPFARLVRYRGNVTALVDGVPTNFTVAGFHGFDPPEPASWLLIVIGGLSLSVVRRRKRERSV